MGVRARLRAVCVVANPRNSQAIAVVCASQLIPNRIPTPSFEIMNTFLFGSRCAWGRADVLALGGKHSPNNKYKNNSYYRK